MSRGASLLLLVALTSVVQPAVSLAQVRDAVAAPVVSGTALIEGTVVTDDADHRPVHRATVTIVSGALGMPQSTVTDDAGAFVFTGVAAANYTIEAAKPAYVTVLYGAKRSGGFSQGVPVAVLDHQRVTGIELRMPHGAVITGALRYTDGRPASGVSVQFTAMETVNGERRPGLDGRLGITDDRGMYRFFGLAAGDYLLMARPSPAFGSLTGGSDTRQVSPEEIQWAQQALASSQGTAAASPAPPPGRAIAFAPVYYPGSPDASNATAVTVRVGEERAGIDFTIAPVPTAVVAGQVIGLDGAPATGATVGLTPLASGTDFISAIVGRLGGRPSPDGAFAITGVTPGRYRLTARATPPSATKPKDDDPMAMVSALLQGGSGGATLWGEQEVVVDGQDLPGLTIRLQNGLSISGRVVVETSGPKPDVSHMRVSLSTTPAGTSPSDIAMSMMGGASAAVAADGTFTISGLTPDRYRLMATAGEGGIRNLIAMVQPGAADPAAGGLTVKSAVWQGQDVADVPLDLKPGVDASGVVVTLTDHQTQISGTVRDGASRPTPNFPIVAFSTNRAHWIAGSRRIQQARVLSDGRFTITGLPAGEYYIAALTDLNASEMYEPSFLDSIVPAAIKVTLGDGEKKVQDLKLAGGG
jgi:hypothetical protein